MGKMPSFVGLKLRSQAPTIVRMVQAQEELLMELRRDDNWDVERRRVNSRQKHLGTALLTQASGADLKRYYLHLIEKQLEVLV